MECQFKRAFKLELNESGYTPSWLWIKINLNLALLYLHAQTGINFKCYVPLPLHVAPALNRKHYAQLFYKKL